MSSHLSSDSEAFIVDAVARGQFRDRDDALEAGIALLRRHDQLLARLCESRRQLDEGEYVEFDDEGLKQLAEQLKDRARRAAESTSHA